MKQLLKKPLKLVIILFTSFLLVLVTIFVLTSNTLKKNQLDALIQSRDLAVSEIEQEFSQIESIIMSVNSFIQTQSDLTGLLSYLESIDEQYPLISSIYFGMPDKTMINSSGFVPPPTFDLTTRLWYQMSIAEESVVFTDAFINATNDRVIITGAFAVYDTDTLIGVIGVDIDILAVTTFINDMTDNEGGYAFLYDNNNNIIAHSERISTDISLDSIELYSIPLSSITTDIGVTDSITIDSVKGIIAYDEITSANYTFGVFMSNSALYQNSIFFSFIGIWFLALLFAISAVTLIIYKLFINEPLNALILDIKKIDPKNKFKFRFFEGKKAKFKDARHALNELLDITVDYQKQAEHNLKEFALSNQKYNLLLGSASDIVFQTDRSFRYTEIYGSALALTGKTEAEFIGKTFQEVYGEKISGSILEKYYSALEGQKATFTWNFKSNISEVCFETVISPLYDINRDIVGVVGVTRDITEQQLRYEKVVHISNHDYLTNLYNRRYYIEELERLDILKQYPFGVMNIDVNGLKIINDAYGHATGDLALIKTGEILLQSCSKKYIVSRVGGDEFTVILPHTGEETTKKLREKLMKKFSEIKISNINLSVAIGYSIKVDNSIDVDEVRKLAENDMFRHKISERKSVKNKAISAILKTLTDKYDAEKIHSERVSEISLNIGKALKLNDEELNDLSTAALFHDIGKISIPDAIINKPGKLSKEEFEILKTHTDIGYEILRAADEYSELAIYASSHHERWDGLGYPKGLKGEEIPLFSRIISIADSYEAMTADRPYRKKQSNEYAVSELIKYAGTQFDYDLTKLYVEEVLHEKWDTQKCKK
ncbi:diguanylate cyclase [Mycoplasmatota bacterium WC30]